MSDRPKPVDLVLEGGGVKAIGLAGAYSVLHERGYRAERVAGSSAGAIAAALIAAGYTAEELHRLVLRLDFEQFRDRAWEDRLPIFERAASLLLDFGLYEGGRLLDWMRDQLARKGVYTFRNLVRDPGERDPRYRYRLQVIASDVTNRTLLVLPRDAEQLGISPDELEVATAVRMSATLPVFFEPVRHRNPETGREHLIVDGGLLSNFPVWLFDVADRAPRWPTFGLLLVEPESRSRLGERPSAPEPAGWGIGAFVDYLKALAETVTAVRERLYLEQAEFARTIAIPTLGVRTTEFDVPREGAEALYESGRRAAEVFLDTWDFETYVAEFRSGREHSRRRALVDALRGDLAA